MTSTNEEKVTSTKETLEKVRSIVADQLCLDEKKISSDAHFSSELGADSLDVVELVMALEEGFEIVIPDESASEISTVQEAADFIQLKLNK